MTKTPKNGYVDLFDAADSAEAKRLHALSMAYDDCTQRHIRSLPLNASPRCLDVGSGSGMMSRWFAEDGMLKASEVVALDTSPACVRRALKGKNNVRIMEADITDPNITCGTFDLIHVRLVLMHLREREAVLEKLVSWLRPGGWLVITDLLWRDTHLPKTAFNRVMSHMWVLLGEQIGTDTQWITRVRPLLANAGVSAFASEVFKTDPQRIVYLEALWRLTLTSMKDQLLAESDITEFVFECALSEVRQHVMTQHQPQLVTCSARFG